jgi:PKD repeat protein
MNRGARDLGVLLSLTLLIAAASGAVHAAGATPNSLTMAVVGTTGTTVTGSAQFSIGGDTPVRIAVARLSGGNAKVVAGPDVATRAIEFPAYVKSGTYPRAVVSVTPTSGGALSPGAADFEYGAVFRLNATSSGRSIDNGDNVFQRGLYEDASQFKLQIDHGYPSCLVRGSAGQVFASSSLKVTAGKWYRATCSRIGTKVTVQVSAYGSNVAPVRAATNGSSGTLTFASTQPAAIGGKVSRSGAVVSSATDQFNGAVANAWVNRVPVVPPPNQPPEAHAGGTCTGLVCSFSGADSTDTEGDPLTYAWDFGDGTDSGAGVAASHTYTTGAARTVMLTVTDDHGNSDTDTVLATSTDPVEPGENQPPVAHASATCSGLECTFSAADSSDPENQALTYAWDFADGTDPGSGVSTSHTYSTGAVRTVTLTVTDDHDNSDTETVVATTTTPPATTPITFVAGAATNGNRTSHAVTVPASVRAGDALVLFFAANTTTPKYTDPAGWTVIQSRNGDGTVVRAYCKIATATDAGSTVKVTSSAYAKSDLTVVAYRNASMTNPIAASASKVDNSTGAAHVSPAVTAVGSQSWLLTYWADESTSTTAWTAPAGQEVRAKTFGSAGGHISALLTDSNAPVAAGATGQMTATANSKSARGLSVSILLAGKS